MLLARVLANVVATIRKGKLFLQLKHLVAPIQCRQLLPRDTLMTTPKTQWRRGVGLPCVD